MIGIRATLTTTAADRADRIVRNTGGLLRQIIEQYSIPKIENLSDNTVRVEPAQSTSPFVFGSEASRRWFWAALSTGTIPFKVVNGHRVYARQGVLTRSWRLKIDTRQRGENGGIVSLTNSAEDVLNRPYPGFVYNRTPNSTSQYRQQPGHFNWNKDWTSITRQMNRIIANDINAQFRRRFKDK